MSLCLKDSSCAQLTHAVVMPHNYDTSLSLLSISSDNACPPFLTGLVVTREWRYVSYA